MTLWFSALYFIFQVSTIPKSGCINADTRIHIIALLRTKWTDLLQHILEKLRKPQPPVVSVELITHDRAYTAVDDFVRRKIRTIPDLTRVFATFEDSNDEESDDQTEDSNNNNKKSLVQFYPRKAYSIWYDSALHI